MLYGLLIRDKNISNEIGDPMYPDQIKNYTTEKQFEAHKRMLAEMKEHFKNHPVVSNDTFIKLADEERLLARLYKKWRKHQGK